MNFYLDQSLMRQYKSASQQVRVMTESWLGQNAYCPNCGRQPITQFENNRPVADFYCQDCAEQFELKSKSGQSAGRSVADGAYQTMIERIQSEQNPNFFCLSYRKVDYAVRQLVLIPKHFVTPAMIVPRKQGIPNRPNYIMCSMNIGSLPESGKILLINQGQAMPPETVFKQWRQYLFLRQQKTEKKGWLLAIMKCADRLPEKFFLKQMYEFETELAAQFPENKHIKDKIRQQLQILRDQGKIEFLGNGHYRKLPIE